MSNELAALGAMAEKVLAYRPPEDKPTGYSVYWKDAKKRTKQNTLAELYPELPNQRFDVILADPPWDYNGKLQFDHSSKGADKIDLSKNIFISSAAFKYPTLKTTELMKLPVQKIAKNDCLLFMWATSPHLVQAIALGQAWGFEYRTVAFVCGIKWRTIPASTPCRTANYAWCLSTAKFRPHGAQGTCSS